MLFALRCWQCRASERTALLLRLHHALELLAGVHAELGVDVADVGVHGGVRHAEALCDGGRVEVVHQQGEHLRLAGRESVRDDEAAQALALFPVEVAQARGLAVTLMTFAPAVGRHTMVTMSMRKPMVMATLGLSSGAHTIQ